MNSEEIAKDLEPVLWVTVFTLIDYFIVLYFTSLYFIEYPVHPLGEIYFDRTQLMIFHFIVITKSLVLYTIAIALGRRDVVQPGAVTD